jgi:hypothetical protein
MNKPSPQSPEAPEAVPEQKPGDADDTSSAGEEDPGAAVEEMHDPHPRATTPKA